MAERPDNIFKRLIGFLEKEQEKVDADETETPELSEVEALRKENAELKAQLKEIEEDLATPLTDEEKKELMTSLNGESEEPTRAKEEPAQEVVEKPTDRGGAPLSTRTKTVDIHDIDKMSDDEINDNWEALSQQLSSLPQGSLATK